MTTQEQKIDHVDKILASDIFRGKDIYQKLLRYLINSSFKGVTPKEVTVAREVFQKGKNFNASEDAAVRVHMHNLRNKLERYYQTDGVSDSLKLYIPKGHYQVQFIEHGKPKSASKQRWKNISIYLLGALVCLLIIFIVIDKRAESNRFFVSDKSPKNNELWNQFFSNNYPAFVVIGDFLVFHEYDSRLDRPRRIQDYMINTKDELNDYIKKHPENYPEPWDLGELPHNSIYNIIDIFPLFEIYKQDMTIRFTSGIDINFIKNRNLIYIGEFKNLRALSDLVATLPIKYETLPWWHGTLTFPQHDSLTTIKTSRDWTKSRYVTDLGMIAKLPGYNNENYIFFAGFGYDAQIKLVNLLCRKESLRKLENQITETNGRFPDYFVMAFEVEGFDRASSTAEIKFFSALDKAHYLKNLIPDD